MRKPLGYTFFLTPLLLAAVSCSISPPVQEMSDARQAITAAEVANADDLAPSSLGNAKHFLVEAEAHLKQRQYALARSMARIAKNSAVEALEVSQTADNSADQN